MPVWPSCKHDKKSQATAPAPVITKAIATTSSTTTIASNTSNSTTPAPSTSRRYSCPPVEFLDRPTIPLSESATFVAEQLKGLSFGCFDDEPTSSNVGEQMSTNTNAKMNNVGNDSYTVNNRTTVSQSIQTALSDSSFEEYNDDSDDTIVSPTDECAENDINSYENGKNLKKNKIQRIEKNNVDINRNMVCNATKTDVGLSAMVAFLNKGIILILHPEFI